VRAPVLICSLGCPKPTSTRIWSTLDDLIVQDDDYDMHPKLDQHSVVAPAIR
jgi:hypothetical protein